MPRLDEITTKGGDEGKTSLVDGTRVVKSDQRVNTYGTVDELNSVLGLVRCETLPPELHSKIPRLQNALLNLGAELATPLESEFSQRLRKINQAQISELETWLESARKRLQPAETFILPGGTRAAAMFHLARTVTRRCERELVALMEKEAINPLCLVYLNRLSDLCFVWARLCNDEGRNDIFWQPDSV